MQNADRANAIPINQRNQVFKLQSKGVLISFRCNAEVEALLHEKHERTCNRLRRMQLNAFKSGARKLLSDAKLPSFSTWVRRELEVAIREFENDRFVGGNFRRVMASLINPSDGDVARVILSFSVIPNWTGYLDMHSYIRWRQMLKAEADLSSRLPFQENHPLQLG